MVPVRAPRTDPAAVAAAALLGCRTGATAAEVRAAYRRTLLAGRPDLGTADALWLERVRGARDLLLDAAAPDRRRRPRDRAGDAAPPEAFRALRRAAWGLVDDGPPAVDLRL